MAPNWYRRAFEHVFDFAAGGSSDEKDKGPGLNLPNMIEARQTNNIAEFLQRVSACVWGQQFLASTCEKPGYFGLVPREAAPGDMICLLDGCSVPVIFRGKPMTEFVIQSLRLRFVSQGPEGLGLLPATEEWIVSEQKTAVIRILRLWSKMNRGMFSSSSWPRFAEIRKPFWEHLRGEGLEQMSESQARDELRRFLELALRESMDVTLRGVVEQGAVTLGLEGFFRGVVPEAMRHPLDADLFPTDSSQNLSWADTLVRQLFPPLFVRGFEEAIKAVWGGEAYMNLEYEQIVDDNTGPWISVDERRSRFDAAFHAAWESTWSSVWNDSRHLAIELWSGELNREDWTESLYAAAEVWMQTWRREPAYRGEVIGECYIQGLMDGEWWSGGQAKEQEAKVFCH